MGIMYEYFAAESMDAAAELVETESHLAHSWDQAQGRPDPTADLEVLLSVVTGIPERDLDLSATTGVHRMVEEAVIVPVPPQLVTALAGLPDERFAAVADDLDEACIDLLGDTEAVLRDFSEYLQGAVASGQQVFALISP